MSKILVTGGTVFVSRYVAEYFVKRQNDVYVLNRNSRKQSEGVRLIEADRGCLQDKLEGMEFDAVIDVTAYTENDVKYLLESGIVFKEYVLISSSAVYPEYGVQPFVEEGVLAENKYWGIYGTNKIAAEKLLLQRVPDAYIIRPPYLYGKYNNVYREAFVFECAMNDRKFYLPGKGDMKLQFFDVEDLCRLIDILLEKKPDNHIFNVGNRETVTIKDWASMCYEVVGKLPEFVEVSKDIPQRSYFSFADYEYQLNVDKQDKLLPDTKELLTGLREAYEWYRDNENEVNRKQYIQYIDENFES